MKTGRPLRLLPWLALLVALAFSNTPLAKDKARSAGPEQATLWAPLHTVIEKVDGVKVKWFPVLWKPIAPGEHVVQVRYNKEDKDVVHMRTFRIRATFEKGHTYCWQVDDATQELFFNDLGEGVLVPDTGNFSWSPEYLQEVADARNKPVHAVAFIPKSEWK